MSFDTIFDYTKPKMFLQKKIQAYQAEIQDITDELNKINSLPDEFKNISTERVTHLDKKKLILDESLLKLSNVVNEIEIVENLNSTDKDNLLYFYQNYLRNPEHPRDIALFMMRMMYNTGTMTGLVNSFLQYENNNAFDNQTMIELIKDKTPISNKASSILKSFSPRVKLT